jgi:hypothetical protein
VVAGAVCSGRGGEGVRRRCRPLRRPITEGVVDLELGSGVGDEDDQEPGPFRRAGVLREDVLDARLLNPVLAWVECADRCVVELR